MRKQQKEMSQAEKIAFIQAIDAEKVPQVYSGKPGCACGCRGIHRYNPKFIARSSKDRGYAITPDEVNMTQIRRVVNVIKANAAAAEYSNQYREIVSFETNNRLFVVYLRRGK